MPSTNSRNLTLITVDNNVTINVKYNAFFSPFERHLAANGLHFHERIRVLGIDFPGSTTGTILHSFPAFHFPVTAGAGFQTIARNVSITRTRASLQEDAGLGDADEIRCRIEIDAIGMPPPKTTSFTDLEVLLG